MIEDQFNSGTARERAEAHRSEARRLRALARQATTAGMRQRLEEQAMEHEHLAAAQVITG